MPTKIAFWISLFATLLGPLVLPKLHLFYFAPYLVLSLNPFSRYQLLWRALLSGLILDLLSSGTFFGLTPLNYCLICWLLYGQTPTFLRIKSRHFL